MNEFIYLFVTLAVVGIVLILLKKNLELEAERKIVHILSWIFVVVGMIGIVGIAIVHFFIATP